MFCASCGTLLRPEKTPYGKWMRCPDGHPQPELQTSGDTVISGNVEKGSRVLVGDGVNRLAVHDHPCKKCGHGKAELIEIAPFYSDEDYVLRMKCGKCGKTEQLDGKVK